MWLRFFLPNLLTVPKLLLLVLLLALYHYTAYLGLSRVPKLSTDHFPIILPFPLAGKSDPMNSRTRVTDHESSTSSEATFSFLKVTYNPKLK